MTEYTRSAVDVEGSRTRVQFPPPPYKKAHISRCGPFFVLAQRITDPLDHEPPSSPALVLLGQCAWG